MKLRSWSWSSWSSSSSSSIIPHQVNPKQLHGILHWISCHHQATDSAAAGKLPQQPPHPGANTFRTWCLGTLCYDVLCTSCANERTSKANKTWGDIQYDATWNNDTKVSHTESEIIMCVFFSESTVALSTPPCAKNKYTRWTFRSIQLSTSFNQYNDIICITYYIAIVCRWTC